MTRGVFRFQKIDKFKTDKVLSEKIADATFDETVTGEINVELLRQEPPMSNRDETIFLLQTAAEIEHSLLVHYLYSAFSLDISNVNQQRWRETIMEIAREEMAHFLSVQNLLRSLGGTFNLEREDYPFNAFYPFHLQLEPFSLKSISRYVLAEMPQLDVIPPELGFNLDEVKRDAEIGNTDETVNRVGALFTLLLKLADQLQLSDFRANTLDWQESGESWGIFGKMIVQLVRNKSEAKSLIEAIGTQGEGPNESSGEQPSHFRRFFQIYEEIKENPSDAAARIFPNNPTTKIPTLDGGEENPGFISNLAAKAWANLFDNRYRLLLADLTHVLAIPKTNTESSEKLINWAIAEMFNLSGVAEVLAQTPQHTPPRRLNNNLLVAGPPFSLPYSLQMPDQELDRWRQQEQLLTEAALRAEAVRAQIQGANALLEQIVRTDAENLLFVQRQIQQLSLHLDEDESDDPTDEPNQDFVLVGNVEQFPVNSVNKITVQGEERVLYHADTATQGVDPNCPFYASQLYCWHRHPETHPTIHCELSGTGQLIGKRVTCQTVYKPGCAHGSKYDITTGAVLQGPANRNLIMFATKCVDNQVWVAINPLP